MHNIFDDIFLLKSLLKKANADQNQRGLNRLSLSELKLQRYNFMTDALSPTNYRITVDPDNAIELELVYERVTHILEVSGLCIAETLYSLSLSGTALR